MPKSLHLSSLSLLCLSLLLLGFLLFFPTEALPAAKEGLSLWLNTMLPTLLPFLILSSLLMQTGMITRMLSPLSPFFRCFFGLTPAGGYALVIGLLCGFPMGARISSELYKTGEISRKEAEYLLTFSCNASPAFLVSYLGIGCLKGQIPLTWIFVPLLFSDLLCMCVFRVAMRRVFTGQREVSHIKKETASILSPGVLLDVSIMNGFETITRLGGYLLLFSILNATIAHFWPFSRNVLYVLSGMMELTTGLHSLSQSALPLGQIYLLSMAMVSFGGVCVLAQTRSCLEPSLSVKPYVTAKLLNMGLTVLISLFLIHLF